MIFSQVLGNSLRVLLETDSRVVVMGEDIVDPYGGAFKVTKGLSSDFPNRVISTPISESAITGIAAGMALDGMRPIVEIMFGDFITLCFDQLVNHIAKYEQMYNGAVQCPVILRTPSGGGRGYGPTHSQSLEKHLMGIPSLDVVAASLYHDPLEQMKKMLSGSRPTVYIEHKQFYAQHIRSSHSEMLDGFIVKELQGGQAGYTTLSLSMVPEEDCDICLLAYGYYASVIEPLMRRLALEEEIFIQLLVPQQLSPIDTTEIEAAVRRVGRLMTVEEGTASWCWGTEVAQRVSANCFGDLRVPVRVCASEESIIPSARDLERNMLVQPEDIESGIKEMLK